MKYLENKKERLEQLKQEVEAIEIGCDLESVYSDLINATINYQNETQTWDFEGIFEEYIDDELLKYQVEYNLKEFGVWAVRNLLDDIKNENGVYRIDVYGYGHDLTSDNLQDIKEQILDIINDKLAEKK